MASDSKLKYTGGKKRQPQPGEKDKHGRPIYGYLPDEGLVEAVNLAIYLNRPLLIKGEPGCGKTELAYAVAYDLGFECEPWYIKSTSRAHDGLYTYDTLARLQDSQLRHDISDHDKYIHLGSLGRAIESADRRVVLIDEIDKADIDFPNDLLLELGDFSFVIKEKNNERIMAKPGSEPIIFITSNAEKDLPDAFLRRCLFYYIDFPDEKRLIDIINIHCGDVAEAIKTAAIEHFVKLRLQMKEEKQASGKKVSTSELIDWVKALQYDASESSEQEVLARLENGELPGSSTILKSREDQQNYQGPKSAGVGS